MLLKNDCIQRQLEIGFWRRKCSLTRGGVGHRFFRPVFVALPIASLIGALEFPTGSTGHVFPVQLPRLRSRKPRRMVADRAAICCHACGRAAIVPAPMEPLEGGSTWEFAVRFACPVCGRSFATKPVTHRTEDPVQWLQGGCEGSPGQFVPCRVPVARCAQWAFRRQPSIAPAKQPEDGARPPAGHSIPVANAWRVPFNGDPDSIRSCSCDGTTNGVRPPADHSIPVANAWRAPLEGDSDFNRSMAQATGAAVWDVEAKSGKRPVAVERPARGNRGPDSP